LFLAGQLRIFRSNADLTRILVTATPIIGAFLVAASRIEDYRHDKYDVTVGCLLGIATAFLVYRRYYPSLRSSSCNTPYPNPVETSAFTRVRDEEEGYAVAAEYDVGSLADEVESPGAHQLTPMRP
jgi:diacylglycerol diphosphate phosphatase / phosphatidate phosphatase